MKPLLRLKKLCKSVEVLRHFVDNDGVCDKCIKFLLCGIIEQLGQNGGKIGMGGVEAQMVKTRGGHRDFLSRHCGSAS